MTLVDVKLTQGSYWKGAQLPYWVYMVVVVLVGGLGLDHLLLRSPMTFLMKLLIPTLGFWYFYDIAQVFGERELVEKYGLGLPLYGPSGIGAGMFFNKDATNMSPPTVPKPWIFMLYAVLSIFFFIIPLNKVLIGDYAGCIAQLSMYTVLVFFSLGLSAILAICWGIYDAYRVIFDTKGLFEKGAARVFPATYVMDPYFNKGALGPEKAPVVKTDEDKSSIISKIINYVIGIYTFGPRMALSAATSAAKVATDTVSTVTGEVKDTVVQQGKDAVGAINSATGGLATKVITKVPEVASAAVEKGKEVATKVGEKVSGVATKVVGAVTDKAQNMSNKVVQKFADSAASIEKKVDDSITGAAQKVVNKVTDKITSVPTAAATALGTAADVATLQVDAAVSTAKGISAAKETFKAATDAVEVGPKLMHGAVDVAKTGSSILEGVTDKLADPKVQDAAVKGIIGSLIPASLTTSAAAPAASAAAGAIQKGGAYISEPSVSTTVVLFSVALLAFGGYVLFSMRKAADFNRNERDDDSPPDPDPVRKSSKEKRGKQ